MSGATFQLGRKIRGRQLKSREVAKREQRGNNEVTVNKIICRLKISCRYISPANNFQMSVLVLHPSIAIAMP
jgi:hypothetical protein